MAAQTYPTVTPRVGNFNTATWRPLFELRLDPGYLGEDYRYGTISNTFSLLDLAGRKMDLTTDSPKIFEKLEWENTVKTTGVITAGGAGATITFTIHTDDQDSVVVGDVLLLPGQYQTSGEDRQYVITDVTAHVVTAVPRSAAATSIVASRVNANIPAGTVLSVAGYSVGRGGTLPNGKYNYRAQRSFSTVIIDKAFKIEGGLTALKWYEVPSAVPGQMNAFFEGQSLLELEMNKACEAEFFLGELNDNAALTTTSGVGGTNKQKATKGILTWANEVGSSLDYAGGVFDFSYLYDVKDLALAKMVAANEFNFLMGHDLQRSLEQNGTLEFIKDYSGGSDLFRTMDEVGIDVTRIKVNGSLFSLQNVLSLSNPQRFGNKTYNLSKMGIIVPEAVEAGSYNGVETKFPSFQIGYLNNNGENRTKIMGIIGGTTGRSQATHRADYDEAFIKTEFAAIVMRPEQLIVVAPE
jgi:hypothetical protein